MKQITVAYLNQKFDEPIKYTFNLIFSILGIPYQIYPYSELPRQVEFELLISYGRQKLESNTKYHIHIYESELFGEHYLTSLSLPELPLDRWRNLPVIYRGLGDLEDLVVKSCQSIYTNIDVAASSFFMVSQYEDVVIDAKDQYERFPANASIAYKENFLIRPIANEYINLLWRWIDSFDLGFKRKQPWGGKDFAVLLTHDVDRVQKYRWWRPPLNSFIRTIKKRQLGKALNHGWDWLTSLSKIKSDPYWNFDSILEVEHNYGFRSSFYFMAGGTTSYDRGRYRIDTPRIINLIKKIEEMGHEVGLHGSYDSFDDYDIFQSEKSKLNQIVLNKRYGGRQHYLRWKTPHTWRILEKAEMLYDTTLSYADHVGFRCGICHPYKPFDILSNRVLDIWEIPLTVMEASLFNDQNLSLDERYEYIQSLIDATERYGGVFVTLWHNCYFYELENPGAFEIYKQMLNYIRAKNALCCEGTAIACSWIQGLNHEY